MANWYYYNENSEKVGPISASALKELARQGLITKETKVENSNGRTAVAGSVSGLTFAEQKQPEASPSFASSMNGFDFPDLTSAAHTPNDFDPFASTTPVASPVPVPSAQSTFTKPIVLVPVSAGAGMLLMLLIVLVYSMIAGGKGEKTQDGSREKVINNAQEVRQNKQEESAPRAVQQNKPKEPSIAILLKQPLPKEDFMQATKIKAEQFVKEQFRPAVYGDHLIAPYIQVSESGWDVTNAVYAISSRIQDEKELLPQIAALQKSYVICMANIATQWNLGIQTRLAVFNGDMAILQTTNTYNANYCYDNLEQIMTAITAHVKTLNKEKYANTIKLYAILSKYKKSVTAPSGSLKNYSENMAAYQEEFTEAMSLAELEW